MVSPSRLTGDDGQVGVVPAAGRAVLPLMAWGPAFGRRRATSRRRRRCSRPGLASRLCRRTGHVQRVIYGARARMDIAHATEEGAVSQADDGEFVPPGGVSLGIDPGLGRTRGRGPSDVDRVPAVREDA